MLNGKVHINDQEKSGNYLFTGVGLYMTCGFQNLFGETASTVALTALELILQKYPNNADYLQTFEFCNDNGMKQRFWCINDVDHIIFLLPEEY